jgi:hypothetical protein
MAEKPCKINELQGFLFFDPQIDYQMGHRDGAARSRATRHAVPVFRAPG